MLLNKLFLYNFPHAELVNSFSYNICVKASCFVNFFTLSSLIFLSLHSVLFSKNIFVSQHAISAQFPISI